MTILPAAPDKKARAALDDLLAGATNERRRASLQAVYEVLVEMLREGVRDFGISTVGRRLEARGIMRTQSLRNAGGAAYRHLIQAFASEAALPARAIARPGERQKAPIEQAIDAIPDINVRAQLRWLLDDHKLLRRRVDELKAAFKCVSIGAAKADPLPRDTVIPPAAPISSGSREIDAVGIAAISRFLSEDWIAERGWEVSANGGIYDSDGQMVAPPGFVSCLMSLTHDRCR